MTDLHERFRNEFDEVKVPDLWGRIEHLAANETATARPQRSRVLVAVAAAAAVLLLIGGPLLLLASTNQDEPVADTSTTVLKPQALTEVDPPWSEDVTTIELLSDGGIVAATSDPDRVLWSPDVVRWFDADPDRQVIPRRPRTESEGAQFEERIIVATKSHAAIRGEANDGIWVAAPETGQWRFIDTAADETDGRIERVLSLAANDTNFLVVTRSESTGVVEPTHPDAPESIPYVHEYAVWIIDPTVNSTERHSLSLPASEWTENPMAITSWFSGQWFIAMHRTAWTDTDEGWATSTPVMASTDGRSWTLTESNFPPDSTTSISAGPNGMIATECNFGGDTFWYSNDGVDWEVTTSNHMGHRSAYIDGLGFLTFYKGSATAYSPDGREWQTPAAAGVTVQAFDGTDSPGPTAASLFVTDNRLMQWSIDQGPNANEGTG